MYKNVLLSHHCYITVRLVNGSIKYEGIVEVYHNGEWGRVCDYAWNLNDAQVVCKELGFGDAITATHGVYEQYSGSVRLLNLQCVGTELTIGNCSHSGWGIRYCGRYDNASVKCASGNSCLG